MKKTEAMKHKIGEQWIEVIDGKKHMLKAVPSVDIGACTACDFEGQESKCAGFPNSVCGSNSDSFIIKDLGVLNDDGLLPCPFCGEYPKIIHPTENMPVVSIMHTGVGHRILLEFFSSEQEAIDTWNRRA